MAVNYQLVLDGDLSPAALAARALPDTAATDYEREDNRWTLDEWDSYGLLTCLRKKRNGYVDASTAADVWEWEPAVYGSIFFRLRGDVDRQVPLRRMLQVVGRAIAPDRVDMAFRKDELVLLRRRDGRLEQLEDDYWSYVDMVPLPWTALGRATTPLEHPEH